MSPQPKYPENPVDVSPNHGDDGQLRIRIPNPKVYMARQSQWIGRRGKPRCDHCRIHNLKCDRIAPICNHCAWSSKKDCTYTPLPTPAHRGIPRCDRCRATNQKCDRNLPVCNKCRESPPGTECNYTPKKRHQRKMDKDSFSTSSQIIEKVVPEVESDDLVEANNHTFYGHNIATIRKRSLSLGISDTETSDYESTSHTGRFTADFAKAKPIDPAPTPEATQSHLGIPQLEVIPHRVALNDIKKTIPDASYESWFHPSLLPLPQFVHQTLRRLRKTDMPPRQEFEQHLAQFLDRTMEPLKDTALLTADQYFTVVKCLLRRNTTSLPVSMRSWITIHKLCTGPEKSSIILLPHDTIFSMDHSLAEQHRERFVSRLLEGTSSPEDLQDRDFDQLIVREQLFDLLAYAHRSHSSSSQMVHEISRLGYAFITWPMTELYVALCPECNISD